MQQLRDGRELSYAEYGASSGRPVLYFHGLPGSRLDPLPFAEEYLAEGIRVVAPDRPGYGRSSPRRRWGLLDWVGDVVELADVLGIGRFAVLGYSSGGKYAAACAFSVPERLSAVGIVSGVGPASMPGFRDGLGKTDRLSMTLATRARRSRCSIGAWQPGWLCGGRTPLSPSSRRSYRTPTAPSSLIRASDSSS